MHGYNHEESHVVYMIYFNFQSDLLNSALALESYCDAAVTETSSCQSATALQ